MNGNVVVKSFSTFQVNEGLLAKVVEAIKKGEADARRYSQVRSFEIYYDGFRSRMVLGRIMIIPAKVADSVEDFPAALLYGAMVKEIHPEAQADLYTYRLGESEFDEYDKKGLQDIKDKLFKDAEGKFRSIVLFVPTWGNVRDYVVLKFNKDTDILTGMVRQQIYGAYYNPAFSSAFDHLSNDTDKLNVSDITPKINFPGLAEGENPSFPELVPGDGSKTASVKKPIMLLAADTVNEISEEFLEPGELAVIDELADELKAKVSGEVAEPKEVAKEATALDARCEGCGTPITRGTFCAGTYCSKKPKAWKGAGKGTPDVNHPRLAIGNAFKLVQKFQLDGEMDPSLVHKAIALLNSIQPTLYTNGQEKGVQSAIKHLDEYMTYDGGADENLARAFTDLEDLCVEMGVKVPGMRSLASKDDTGATTGLRNQPDYGESDSHTSEANAAAMKGASTKTAARGAEQQTYRGWLRAVKVLHPNATIEGDQDIASAFDREAGIDIGEWDGARGLIYSKQASKTVVAAEGATLVREGSKFTLKAASGHTEPLRINANKVKWARPLQFTLAFRAAVETFVRNPNSGANKTADVPQTFDEIWGEIAEEMGPAPSVTVKEAPKAESSAPSEPAKAPVAPQKTKLEKLEERTGKPAPEVRVEPAKEEKPEEKKDEPESKEAAFDMFIPGQVLEEFYPEVLHETVEYPTTPSGGGNGYDPGIGLPGDSPTGVQQSADGLPPEGEPYISTDPTAAMGLGRDGKPQILEGAPLRTEQDIRGYGFDQEFYAQNQGIDPKAFSSMASLARVSKKASTEEFKAQFADFLKKAMGEIAATFIAAFKVTSRPLMNKVPGTGEIKLDEIEHNATFSGAALNVSSRVAYLMSKLTDSDIKGAINGAWAQSAVWNEDTNGGYTYEVFIRPDSLDKQTLVLKYNFVVGTKGL